MKQIFKTLFKDEDWAWGELADALIEYYGCMEPIELITCMTILHKDKDKILKEICNRKNIQKGVLDNLSENMYDFEVKDNMNEIK